MSLSKTLKARWMMLSKGGGYADAFVERLYALYLNHTKIIHYRDGYPVYSLSTPPLYSKPSANFFARLTFRVLQNRPTPNLMSFAVNDECNASCGHCSFFSSIDDKSKRVLSLAEAKKLIRDAQELGVSIFNFVGGEPLMRHDLGEIIKEVNKDLSITTLFTNGWYLKDRAAELRRAGLDAVYLSLDSADAKKHDTIRGVEGLFAKGIEGIEEAKRLGYSVGISCTLDEQGFRAGEADRMIELAKATGVHEVLIFDLNPVGRSKENKALLDNSWTEELIEHVKTYNADKTYPGVLVYSYATSFRSVGCACGTSYFYVTPYGEVCPCDFYHAKFGSVRDEPLWKLWEKLSHTDGFGQSTWGGCKTRQPGKGVPEEDTAPTMGCGSGSPCASCTSA